MDLTQNDIYTVSNAFTHKATEILHKYKKHPNSSVNILILIIKTLTVKTQEEL